MLTKKYYQLIADEVSYCRGKTKDAEGLDMLVDRLCIVFALDNGLFDEDRFRRACQT